MPKVIATKIENIRKTQIVKYQVNIPKDVINLDKYISECLKNDNLNLGKVVSEETIEGDILENDISKIEIFLGKNNIRVFRE